MINANHLHIRGVTMRKRISILALMMTMIFAFSGCAKAEVNNKDGKISVGVTIYPLQYLT